MTKRVDLDVRPIGPWRKNYDLGEGLYSGKFKHKSVEEFLAERKKNRKKRIKAMQELLALTGEGSLGNKIEALRPDLALAAQKVIDDWTQDEDGIDEELGSGGVCDRVSEAMSEVLSRLENVEFLEGGQDGDDHAFLIVYNHQEAYVVDIPPGIYETGGGYNWRKISDAQILPEDIVIEKIPRKDIEAALKQKLTKRAEENIVENTVENTDLQEILNSNPVNNRFKVWIFNQLEKGHKKEDIIPTLSFYHTHRNQFKNLHFYQDFKDLENAVKDLAQSPSKRKLKKIQKDTPPDSTLLFENDQGVLYRINNKQACKQLGTGTKWCITMDNATFYEQYQASNVIFYFLLTNLEAPLDKIAFAYQRNIDNTIMKVDIFNSVDAEITWPKFSYINQIKSIMDSDAPQQPKALIAKLKSGEGTKQDYLTVFHNTLNLDAESLNAFKYAVRNGLQNTKNTELLVELSTDSDKDVRYNVVRNPNTPPGVLARLSTDSDRDVRYGAAGNPNTPPEALARLSTDSDSDVRCSVAENPNTPPEALARLSTDSDRHVSYNVAGNPNTTPETLARLSFTDLWHVGYSVARNPNTPPEALARLSTDSDSDVRCSVAENPNTPPEVLARLSTDSDSDVRYNVARNPNTPTEILSALSNKYHKLIKKSSRANLGYSAVLRELHKNHQELIPEFMSEFKKAFDQAVSEQLEEPEHLALLQALKHIGVEEIEL